MRITYFALKTVQVGEDVRAPGDLVPEAVDWAFLTGYVRDGIVAPVLVATLPEDSQLMLMEWESEKQGGTPPIKMDSQAPGSKPTSKSNATKEKVA